MALDYTDEELGLLPPELPAYDQPATFQPSHGQAILEALFNGLQDAQAPAPRNAGEGAILGLLGGLGRRGAGVASARQRFEARQSERRRITDEGRRKATEDYNKRKADATAKLTEEKRKTATDIEGEKRKTAAENILVTPEMIARDPRLPKTLAGQSVSERVLKQYTYETPGEKAAAAATNDEALMDDDTVKARVGIYLAGGAEPSFGMGKAGVANRVKFNKSLASEMKRMRMSGADVQGGRSQAVADRGSLTQQTKMYDAIKAAHSTVEANAKVMLGTLDRLPDSGSPVINMILRPGSEKLFGSTGVTDFNNALGTVQTEFARILAGGTLGSQMLTDSARHDLSAAMGRNFTKKQLRGALRIYEQDAANRLRAQESQIGEIKKRMSTIGMPTGDVGVQWTKDANGMPVPAGGP